MIMKKKQYIIPETGVNEYKYMLLITDQSQQLPPDTGEGGGLPGRKSGKEPAF